MINGMLLAVILLSLAVIFLVFVVSRLLIRAAAAQTLDKQMPTATSTNQGSAPRAAAGPIVPGAAQPPKPPASAIAIGVGASRAMEIRVAASGDLLAGCRRVESSLVRNSLASIPQALPQLVLAQQVGGTHLMEVVIRGDLVRAADGAGWRAFSIGPNGFEQHARLFDVGGLQALAAGVMVWQLASILFGQKHLHDINRQLKGINQKLDSILGLLRGERKATILAGWRYIKDAVHAAERGELSESTRQQLESIEYQLTVALYAIRAEFDEVRQRPLARGKVGSSVEFDSLKKSLTQYQALFEDMSACLEVRQGCCYAASLFPGGRLLLGARLRGLQEDIDVFSQMGQAVTLKTREQVSEVTSRWNKESTLETRRKEISDTLEEFTDKIAENAKRHVARGERIETAVSSLDEEKMLYVTVANGKIVDVHESLSGRS